MISLWQPVQRMSASTVGASTANVLTASHATHSSTRSDGT
jgi:hypothetical protein